MTVLFALSAGFSCGVYGDFNLWLVSCTPLLEISFWLSFFPA